ncbi:hypothetical protein PACTADRAFT_33781 [Pachysolen tannophilus NRRL Y-2460]|uniref:PH domain-containing protein n=1 Tax=Pachysolen tannophilus NRRL Y-2460 TaxID=669874 RepID=A0A1E4TTS3_PACTA|nr:hypothetical protein PACTADRAFT_33781 [Pachysolen tannophilus NRRL Y-2460]
MKGLIPKLYHNHQHHTFIQDKTNDIEEIKKLNKEQIENPNKLIVSSYLHKKSSKYHNYKKRWFVLRNCQLSYYKDSQEHKPLGVINGSNLLSFNVDDNTNHHHSNKYYFKIHTSHKEFQLYAEDKDTMQRWVAGLRSVIDYNNESFEEVLEPENKSHEDEDENENENENRNGNGNGNNQSDHDDIAESPIPLEKDPPPFIYQNNSSNDQFSGVDDNNYISNASDSNLTHQQSQQPILPIINENGLDQEKVEKERLKIKAELLKEKAGLVEESQNNKEGDLKDDYLSSSAKHEIIIEKGEMKRLYKRYNQWKRFYIILTNKRLIFYKDQGSNFANSNFSEKLRSEKPAKIILMDDVLDIVELDPLSKTKNWCLLIITTKKRIRFSVENEDELIKWLVAIKMLLSKRKGKTNK